MRFSDEVSVMTSEPLCSTVTFLVYYWRRAGEILKFFNEIIYVGVCSLILSFLSFSRQDLAVCHR